MTNINNINVNINLYDPRQDVNRERVHPRNLNRYKNAEALLKNVPAGMEILELGGGIAELTRRMKNRGLQVTFVDLNEYNIKKAKLLEIAAHRLDLNAGLVPFGDGTFDGVVALEVIEHIVAAEFLLAEIARVLRPGGFLIISTPNFANYRNRLRILAGKLSSDEGYHYRFFTLRTLEERLRNAGMIIEKHAHTTPAVGLNFIVNRLFGRDRIHLRVPRICAPLCALTLFVKARKI